MNWHYYKALKSPFRVNWLDLEQVKEYARKLGRGQTVYKHPNRPNYNITHTARADLYRPEWVLLQT